MSRPSRFEKKAWFFLKAVKPKTAFRGYIRVPGVEVDDWASCRNIDEQNESGVFILFRKPQTALAGTSVYL